MIDQHREGIASQQAATIRRRKRHAFDNEDELTMNAVVAADDQRHVSETALIVAECDL